MFHKTIHTTIRFYVLFILLLLATTASSQCGQRYKNQIFDSVTITQDVVYTTANGTPLKMDIYEPTGDIEQQRPVIIMAHGGSFIAGTKTQDSVVTKYCFNFAKRGYVCASIDYRLGTVLQMLDTTSVMDVVIKCISDGKAAIRFFRKDAATTNLYRINPNMIIVGGNSAGAVLYMQAVYIDSLNEAPLDYRNVMLQNGGLEGNSGNDGYSSQAQALINLAGGINVPELVGPGNTPSFNAQGDADVTIAYNCGYAHNGLINVRLCGLGAIEHLYEQHAIPHYTKIYPGATHTPWQSNGGMMAELDTLTANFLYTIVCNTSTGSTNPALDNSVLVYPNPATKKVTITHNTSPNGYMHVCVKDITGKVVLTLYDTYSPATVSIEHLSAGSYFIEISSNNNLLTKRLIKYD